MRGFAALLILCLCATPSGAAELSRLTGAQLAAMCQSESNLDYGYCAGYVTAVADEMMAGSVAEYRACNHAAVKSQQYVDIFRTYAAEFPETRGMSADLAVAAAFARAFPCSP
jgi:hypothetical protein